MTLIFYNYISSWNLSVPLFNYFMNKIAYYIKKIIIFIKVLIIVFFKIGKLLIDWICRDKKRTQYAVALAGLIFIIFIIVTTFRSCREAAPQQGDELHTVGEKVNLYVCPFGDLQNGVNELNDAHIKATKKTVV